MWVKCNYPKIIIIIITTEQDTKLKQVKEQN